ncbi:6032_t:CDS:2, partial [Paraglomus occultum]
DNEPYFYQQLLRQRSWRSEAELRGPYESYREHYLSLFPEQRSEMLTESTLEHEITYFNIDVIKHQLDHLKIILPTTPPQLMINLPEDQYKVMNVLTNKLEHRSKFLLMAPTGVAAQRIDGKTIHSALRITHQGGTFVTRAFTDQTLRSALSEVRTLIIDEISMVSAQLLSFISDLFAKIHGNASAFGGVNVVLVGDLAQLPPVSGTPVYYSPIWKLFYPLFLTHSRRQENDLEFYKLLEEVRFGNISSLSWRMLSSKLNESMSITDGGAALTTTHIVGYRESAMKINVSICNLLNTPPSQFLVNYAIDTINGSICSVDETHCMFKNKTNLPK